MKVDNTGDGLRDDLAALTEWGESRPGVWRAALNARDTWASAPRRFARPWSPFRSRRVWGMLGTAAVLVLVTAALLPSLGKARQSARHLRESDPAQARVAAGRVTGAENATLDSAGGIAEGREGYKAGYALPSRESGEILGRRVLDFRLAEGASLQSADAARTASDRQVVRKATVELQVPDVRAAFLKASLLISQAGGEFIEDSAMTGAGASATANLTLRVAADRLPEVLGELRPLGKVLTEQVKGEDVTAQAVDLEARVRNERRVEQELLELLSAQKDAPLKDVLEVRQRLSEVRTEIERIEGQRQHLSRLVSLATVLVLIRADDAPPPEIKTAAGVWPQVREAFSGAWRTGVTALIDTLAWLVSVLIGGLIWWVIAAIAAWTIVRRLRRAATIRGEV